MLIPEIVSGKVGDLVDCPQTLPKLSTFQPKIADSLTEIRVDQESRIPKYRQIANSIIADIERQSLQTTPEIEIYPLKHIDDQAVSDLVATIYDQVFGPRQSRVSITALNKPNALLLIGRKENVAAVKELIGNMIPTRPEEKRK